MRIGCLVLALSTLGGCADGDAWQGEPLPTAPLVLYSDDEGVHPDRSVLDDPDNPFRIGALSDDAVWQLQANGGAIAGFYAWATALARGASGERQYYAALDLKAIYQLDLADDPEAVRALSIRGFQAVLDDFPDAVIYDATGTIAYELVTPSCNAILDLGGEVTGGWILITAADGSLVAVRR